MYQAKALCAPHVWWPKVMSFAKFEGVPNSLQCLLEWFTTLSQVYLCLEASSLCYSFILIHFGVMFPRRILHYAFELSYLSIGEINNPKSCQKRLIGLLNTSCQYTMKTWKQWQQSRVELLRNPLQQPKKPTSTFYEIKDQRFQSSIYN